MEIERLLRFAKQLGQQLFRRRDLGVSVALLLDDRGIDPQRDVVHEEAIIHRRIVDTTLQGIPEGVHAVARVPTVQPEIEGEVVSCAGSHAHEGKIVLHGKRRDQGLRAIPTRHPQAVGAPGNGVSGELGEIETVVEHHRFDPEGAGQLRQSELLDLAPARPRVTQQDRVGGADRMVHPDSCARPQAHREGCSCGQDGYGKQPEADECSDKGFPVFASGPEQGGDQERRAHDHPDDPEAAARRLRCDRPPSPGDADHKTRLLR